MIKIIGFEGYYITNLGTVFSGKSGIFLKPFTSNGGYSIVSLCNSGKIKKKLIHRLVAEAFIPNPDNKPCVCHKDDDPSNNYVGNLFWGTQRENIKDMISKGRNNKAVNGRKKSILCLQTGEIFDSISLACQVLDLSAGNVHSVIKGTRYHTKGYTFELFKN